MAFKKLQIKGHLKKFVLLPGMEIQQPYHIYLDYKGYLIEPRTYRVMPAPLMGTRFATGRQAYGNLDFWQVGAMTDFTHGINQKFLVDPSACYNSVGLDLSKPGELKLERDLTSVTLPSSPGIVTARYRSAAAFYLGTSTGKILKSTNGVDFTTDGTTGAGKIYGFYELDGKLFATKGPNKTWIYSGSWTEGKASVSGQFTFTNASNQVTGDSNAKFTTEVWIGSKIMLAADETWVEILSIESDTALTLTTVYGDTGGTGDAKLALENLYFAMVESDYGFGIFDDGIRRSTDGLTWIPIPLDPLWSLPSSEGITLNAISIPRGFVLGSRRGLWVFIGGSSGINLWLFPDYVSDNNFLGMDKWGHYGMFSVENQGIFYTDGVQVYPTNLNYLSEGFTFKSCKSIVTSGWDIFALVKNSSDWYLARCNLNYTRMPKYWWLVKKLSKEPAYLAAYSEDKVFIFYADATAEVYNKIGGNYQTSGQLETSLIDENLIRLQKLYKALSAILDPFPTETSVKLGYRFNLADSYTEKTVAGISQREAVYDLPNPTVDNRIQIRLSLASTAVTKSPVVTDLCWTYILERSSEESSVKKNFYFTVIGEDRLEQLTGEVEELGRPEPRTRAQLIDDIWGSRAKKELLNFIGADNERQLGLQIKYTGSEISCKILIDRTNYQIKTYLNEDLDQTISYKDQSLNQIAVTINAIADYTCSVHPQQEGLRTAHDLEPIKNKEIKADTDLYVGSDIHSIIFNPQSPGQLKLSIEGRGSDRINISLRET